jgi:molecular chaperone GrpE
MAKEREEAQASAQDPSTAPDQAAGQLDEQALRAMLDAARNEADQQRGTAEEYLKMLQRVQADFLNYKRRVEAERESKDDAVRADTIRAFLPIVDDLERALGHIPSDVAKEGWAQGFSLIDRNLAASFERLGLRRLGAEGEVFDPNVHEAVAYEEHPTLPEGHVASVMRPGYQLGERVVRPAQVTVARAAAGDTDQHAGSWTQHEGRHPHGNGGVQDSDLHRPGNIERA